METETYSPRAIDAAPASRPAMAAARIAPVRAVSTAATPTTSAPVETIPSLAPSTPARSQFRSSPVEFGAVADAAGGAGWGVNRRRR